MMNVGEKQMARKQIRVMSAADYSMVTRGGAINYAVPFVITLGTNKGVKELDIFKAPLLKTYDPTIGETTHVKTIREGGKATFRIGTEKYDGEVVAITARKVTLRPLNVLPANQHYMLNDDGNMVEDMAEFCEANIE
jgi:hypothetical protein